MLPGGRRFFGFAQNDTRLRSVSTGHVVVSGAVVLHGQHFGQDGYGEFGRGSRPYVQADGSPDTGQVGVAETLPSQFLLSSLVRDPAALRANVGNFRSKGARQGGNIELRVVGQDHQARNNGPTGPAPAPPRARPGSAGRHQGIVPLSPAHCARR